MLIKAPCANAMFLYKFEHYETIFALRVDALEFCTPKWIAWLYKMAKHFPDNAKFIYKHVWQFNKLAHG